MASYTVLNYTAAFALALVGAVYAAGNAVLK